MGKETNFGEGWVLVEQEGSRPILLQRRAPDDIPPGYVDFEIFVKDGRVDVTMTEREWFDLPLAALTALLKASEGT